MQGERAEHQNTDPKQQTASRCRHTWTTPEADWRTLIGHKLIAWSPAWPISREKHNVNKTTSEWRHEHPL